MDNRHRREALRGAGEETFDLLAEVLTSEQWAELLKAPLEHAARQGNRGLAQKLVEAGAEIGDALHEAVRGGHAEVADTLLENGASIAAVDADHGLTPLHLAAYKGKTEMLQLLLHKGADKDALTNQGWTPLYLAAKFGRVAAALALMAAGANVDLQSKVMQAAVQGGHTEITRAAIERGADVNAVVDSVSHETALHAAKDLKKGEMIDLLVEAGADIEARDRDGCTPLHNAAARLSLEALLALLKHGADVNAQDEDKDTPLHWAAATAGARRAAEVVDSLLRSGADETILNDSGNAAMDLVGIHTAQEEDLLIATEGVERVRKLLANAPADRAWRRRGYLVLCRAHPDRVQQIQDISTAHAGVARRTRNRTRKMGRTEASDCSGGVGAGPMDERGGGDWAVAVAKMLALQEEGIFRTIVGYL